MLSADDKRLYEACVILKNSEQLKPILKWFMVERARCMEALETQPDSNLVRTLQGESQAYKKFLNLVDDASV